MRDSDARRLLNSYCERETGSKASSCQFTKEMNNDGQRIDWWLENVGTVPPSDGPRTRAYLRAYVEIAGPRFFGTGIPVHDKYLQPDRAVMKSLLLDHYVVLEHGKFSISDKGRMLIGHDQPIFNR